MKTEAKETFGKWVLWDHFEKLRVGVLATWTLYISSISIRVFISFLIIKDVTPNTNQLKHARDFLAYVSEGEHRVSLGSAA